MAVDISPRTLPRTTRQLDPQRMDGPTLSALLQTGQALGQDLAETWGLKGVMFHADGSVRWADAEGRNHRGTRQDLLTYLTEHP